MIDSHEIAKTVYDESQYDEQMISQLLATEIEANNKKIVVLDDDPTGSQTVHNISVYTTWTEESIRAGFEEDSPLFYILTNSRALSEKQSKELHQEIVRILERVSKETKREYILISRSDSTLRGHYPLETKTIKEISEREFQITVDGEILCFFFEEGGRYTVDDIHYVKAGDGFIPCGETEFAKDNTFGYKASNICEYIAEKTNGEYSNNRVTSISLQSLRNAELNEIEDKLLKVENFNKVVVNAGNYLDIKMFCIAAYRAMRKGKRYIFRGAASLVKALGGIGDQGYLTEVSGMDDAKGGLIIIGSHTNRTTRQLDRIRKIKGVVPIEFNSDLVITGENVEDEINRVVNQAEYCIAAKKTAVVFTKRKVLVYGNDTKEELLERSVRISQAVQRIVGQLSLQPKFVIAKGGITSSDIATKALRITKATVLGQIQPGVSVWKADSNSKFPDMPYVVFPGNIGDDDALKTIVQILNR